MAKGLLRAFEPQSIVELKKNDKSKIETILAYGDRLLVGLSSGSLRIYRVNEDVHQRPTSSHDDEQGNDHDEKPVELRREVEKFTRRPVQQLAVIKEANVLVSLSDGYVSFHDLQTFELSERLEITKGATAFATISNVVKDDSTDMMTIESHLAVAVKRKILLWSWQDMELTGPPTESSLSAPIKSLAWMTRTKIVAGMDPGFVLVDLDSQESTDIYRPAAAGEATGEQGARFGAVNSSGMGYMGMGSWVPKPMMSKLANDQMLLAKDVNTLFIDQNGEHLDKRQVPWAAAPEAIGFSYPYVLCLQPRNNGTLEIRNPDTMSLLQSISLPNVNYLHVPQPNISLAHAGKGFLVSSDRGIWRMNAVDYHSQTKDLTEKGYFDEAISLLGLLEETLIDDKVGRIRSIKVEKADHLFHEQRYREAMDLFTEAPAPPQHVISLFPKVIAGDLSSITSDDETDQNTRLTGKDLKTAVQTLPHFLVSTRSDIQKFMTSDGALKDAATTKTGPDTEDLPACAHLIPQPTTEITDWQEQLLDVATAVDTTLFRAYMFVGSGLAISLFRLSNFCDPQVVEEKLRESKRYHELISFLHGKRLHKQALELLQKLGQSQDEDVNETFRGPSSTVHYLKQLPFELIEVILEYATWPLETNPDMGMEVFIADTDNAEVLPRDKVLSYLKTFGRQLSVRYLEHIIEEWHEEGSDYHNELIDLYLEEFKSREDDHKQLPHDDLKGCLQTFLSRSTHYDPRHVLDNLSDTDPAFFEPRAILHGRLHQHLKALNLYVFSLQAPDKAESYCNSVYAVQHTSQNDKGFDPDTTKSIYTTLLSLYLDPPPPNKPDFASALELLSRHGSRLPALTTLDFLPPELSIANLESYFRGRMRAANTLAREQAVLRSISAVSKADVDIDLHVGEEGYDEKGALIRGDDVRRGQGRRIELTDERMCAACHKRFGRAAVRVWPNGEVRHYGCGEVRRLGEGRAAGTRL